MGTEINNNHMYTLQFADDKAVIAGDGVIWNIS